MRLSTLFWTISGAATALASERYIVEFDRSLASGLSKRDISPHGSFYDHLRKRDVGFEVRHEWDTDVLVGASVHLEDLADYDHLAGHPDVVKIWPVTDVKPRAPISGFVPGASNDGVADFTRRALKERAGPLGPLSQLPVIKADKQYLAGQRGAGIKVAVIDTGVDYKRAPLGGCLGPNCKVVGGYNYVNQNEDPQDVCDGHGTFAAGIIAAGEDPNYQVPGVAPDVKIYAYRALACSKGDKASSPVSDGPRSDAIIDAMMRADEVGCDVINMSLGAVGGWTGSLQSVVADRLALKGRHIVVAAGNEGKDGMFFSSSPASGLNVYSVGAVHSPFLPDPEAELNYASPPARVNDPEAGLITDFSTVGPTMDLFMSPHLSAPGKQIVSVGSLYSDGKSTGTQTSLWKSSDGTSQATPFTAGAIAVYLSAMKGKASLGAKEVREAFMTTSALIKSRGNADAFESVAVAGSGLIQLDDAISTNTAITPAFNLLNDTANFQSTKYITIRNRAANSITYTLSHVPADTVYGWTNGLPAINTPEHVKNAASVKFSRTSVTIAPGQSSIVIVSFTAPSGLDATRFPVYSGWIQVNGGSIPLRSAYMGVAANMKDMGVRDTAVEPVIMIKDGTAAAASSQVFQWNNDDRPQIKLRLRGGTLRYAVDLVAPDFAPPAKRDLVASAEDDDDFDLERRQNPSKQADTLKQYCQIVNNQAAACKTATTPTNSFSMVPVKAEAARTEEGTPRNSYSPAVPEAKDTLIRMTSSASVEPGSYKLYLRLLKPTGNPIVQADYESWLSPVIQIQ